MKTETIKTYTIYILFGIIIFLLLLTTCNTPIINTIEKQTIKWDTVYRPYEVIKFKPKYYPKYDTIYKVDTLEPLLKLDLCKYHREYNDSLSDSNLTIYSHLKTLGILEVNQISYRLKTPKMVIKTITNVTTVPNKLNLFISGGIGGNQTRFNAFVGAGIKYKNNYYMYDYEVVNKTHNIKLGINIFSSKK